MNSEFVNTMGLSTEIIGKAIIIYLVIKWTKHSFNSAEYNDPEPIRNIPDFK